MSLVQIEEARSERLTPTTPTSLLPLSKQVLKAVEEAQSRFTLIEPEDRIAIGYSGGKDSLALIRLFQQLSARADMNFSYQVIHLDQAQPGFNRVGLQASLHELGETCEIIERDTWSVVESQRKPGQIPCAICGRLRRGILNRWCAEHGFNKLALGHHLDDALETFFLNLLFGRSLNPLKAATPASELPVVTIRPLLFVEERKIQSWINQSTLLPIDCPVCDRFPDAQRREIKGIIQNLSERQPLLYASARQAIYGEKSPLFS